MFDSGRKEFCLPEYGLRSCVKYPRYQFLFACFPSLHFGQRQNHYPRPNQRLSCLSSQTNYHPPRKPIQSPPPFPSPTAPLPPRLEATAILPMERKIRWALSTKGNFSRENPRSGHLCHPEVLSFPPPSPHLLPQGSPPPFQR